MKNLEIVEKLVSNKIIRDLEQVNDLTIVSKDPVGYVVYLYFLLKNKIRNAEVENIIDWMNSWVENILVQRNFSKFVDRELASAIFAYYSLKAFGQLRVKVKDENLEQLFSEHIEDAHFFSNFTFSTIIALSLLDYREKIREYPSLLTWIEKQVEEKNIFNDAKNLVFASILFEKIGAMMYLKKVFDYCYERLLENNIPYHDALYYAYVLWKFRHLEKHENLQKIREFTDESIENAKRSILIKEDKAVEDVYGADIQKEPSKISASKIYLGVFIDIMYDFDRETIKVSKEELTRKDLSRWIILGPCISVMMVILSAGIIWLAFQLNTLIRGGLIRDPTLAVALRLITNGSLFVLVMVLFVMAFSIFLDIVIKRICLSKLIKDNLKSRLKNYVLLEVAFPLILELLRIIFGI